MGLVCENSTIQNNNKLFLHSSVMDTINTNLQRPIAIMAGVSNNCVLTGLSHRDLRAVTGHGRIAINSVFVRFELDPLT